MRNHRVFKFRAFDADKQSFLGENMFIICPTSPSWSAMRNHDNDEIEAIYDDYLHKKGDLIGSGGIWVAEGSDYANLILNQFTGVCDINGVEIYEGDLVKCDSCIGMVIFKSGSFMIEWSADVDAPMDYLDSPHICKTIAVIGNQHTNPELIVF